MQVDYTVHRVSTHKQAVKAIVDGENMTTDADSVEIELVPVGVAHGTLTLRFIGKNRAEAINTFKEGAAVTLSVTPKSEEAGA